MDDGVQAARERPDRAEADPRVGVVEGLDRQRRLDLEGDVGVGLDRRPPAQQVEGGVVEAAQQLAHRLEPDARVGARRVEPGDAGAQEAPEPVVGDDAVQPVGGEGPRVGEGGGIEELERGQPLFVRLDDEDPSVVLALEQAVLQQGRQHAADAAVLGGEQLLCYRLLLPEVGVGELADEAAERVVAGLRRRLVAGLRWRRGG